MPKNILYQDTPQEASYSAKKKKNTEEQDIKKITFPGHILSKPPDSYTSLAF